MPIPKEELSIEQEYLDRVMHVLLDQIDKSREIVERSRSEVIELNRTMMEDIGNDVQSLGKFVDAYSYLAEIDNRAGAMNNNEREHARLLAMTDSPYFARMDFVPKGREKLNIYIGIGSLIDQDTLNFYVFDWRSPVAGMYYDYELGEAKYTAPGGTEEGEVTLKRHFKVWKGEILSAYDSSLAIEDDILSEALSKSADSKMQTIVCTIQREQNKIIRDKNSRFLIAFGPAGSGKTSVAMQRAAFFLYTYRDTITSENLMIFSPNNVFADYISEVLPRLGEANVKSSTFNRFAETLFEGKYKFLSQGQMLDFSVNGSGVRMKAIKLKSSVTLANALKEEIDRLKSTSPGFPDAIYGEKCLISKEEMEKLYCKDFSYLSIQGRMNKLFTRLSVFAKEEYQKKKKKVFDLIDSSLDPIHAKEEAIKLKWEIREEYKSFLSRFSEILSADPMGIYLSVLKKLDKEVYLYTRENLEAGFVQSEDAAAMLYILSSTREIKNEVKYLIIDEAQDYTLLHHMAIRNCFLKASITFLGDTNQSVCPETPLVNSSDIARVFPEASVYNLTKSYRSTKEISEFCGKILGLQNMDYMERSGEKVSMTTLHSKEDYEKALIRQAIAYRDEGMSSAIIFPTGKECRDIYEKYGKKYGLKLVEDGDNTFVTGSCIAPVYMAKGLEYDGVIIPYESYREERLKYLLYTASTRALHSLKLFGYD